MEAGEPKRALSSIVCEIAADWKKPYFGAVPYMHAMAALEGPADAYGADSAKEVVLYFLSNASSWRGEVARRIKTELKEFIK